MTSILNLEILLYHNQTFDEMPIRELLKCCWNMILKKDPFS
jgi:hypothetical protein